MRPYSKFMFQLLQSVNPFINSTEPMGRLELDPYKAQSQPDSRQLQSLSNLDLFSTRQGGGANSISNQFESQSASARYSNQFESRLAAYKRDASNRYPQPAPASSNQYSGVQTSLKNEGLDTISPTTGYPMPYKSGSNQLNVGPSNRQAQREFDCEYEEQPPTKCLKYSDEYF